MQQYMDQIQKAESIKKRKASREAKIREKEKKKQRLLELKNNSTEFVCYLCKTNEEKRCIYHTKKDFRSCQTIIA